MSDVCKVCDGTGAYLVDFGRQKMRCSCQSPNRGLRLTLPVAVYVAVVVALIVLPMFLRFMEGKAP